MTPELMYLITAATRFEMQPFEAACTNKQNVMTLVTGLGPVETAVRLTSHLHQEQDAVKAVINFGVAGAYLQQHEDATPDLLAICLATGEVLGDLGICLQEDIEPFRGKELQVRDTFALDASLRISAEQILQNKAIKFKTGRFVTVNCATGTLRRGNMLMKLHNGLCENMEGAAVARVCAEFGLPCLEVRCISNLVEDRDTKRWQLQKACVRAGEVAAFILRKLVERDE